MPQFQDSLPNSFLEQVTGHQLWYSRVDALLLRCSLKLSIQLPIYPEFFKGTEQMFDEALFIQFSWSLVNQEGNLLMFNHWSIYHCWGKRPFANTSPNSRVVFTSLQKILGRLPSDARKKTGGPCVAGVMFFNTRPICPPSLIIYQLADHGSFFTGTTRPKME